MHCIGWKMGWLYRKICNSMRFFGKHLENLSSWSWAHRIFLFFFFCTFRLYEYEYVEIFQMIIIPCHWWKLFLDGDKERCSRRRDNSDCFRHLPECDWIFMHFLVILKEKYNEAKSVDRKYQYGYLLGCIQAWHFDRFFAGADQNWS